MNYNKNSRKMTARNIVMLIGVLLGIQAGFVSHAMEDNNNNKSQFQQNKKPENTLESIDEIELSAKEKQEEVVENDINEEVNKIPLRRSKSFKINPSSPIFGVSPNFLKDFGFGDSRVDSSEEQPILYYYDENQNRYNYIRRDHNYILRDYSDIIDWERLQASKLADRVETFFKELNTTKSIKWKGENFYDEDSFDELTLDGENFYDEDSFDKLDLDKLYKLLERLFDFLANTPNVWNKAKLNKIFEPMFARLNQLQVTFKGMSLREISKFYAKQDENQHPKVIEEVAGLTENISEIRSLFIDLDFLKEENEIKEENENDLYNEYKEKASKLIEEVKACLKDLNKIRKVESPFYSDKRVPLMTLSEFLNIFTDTLEEFKESEKVSGFVSEEIGKIFKRKLLRNTNLNDLWKNRIPDGIVLLSLLKINCQATLQNISKNIMEDKFNLDQLVQINNVIEAVSNLRREFRYTGLLGKVYDFGKEQASKFAEEASKFLKNFKRIVYLQNIHEVNLLTFSELIDILYGISDNNFSEKDFLSDEIYEKFEQKVLDKKGFKETLDNALNDFNGVDKSFSNKTLQQISECFFDNGEIEILSDLTEIFSKLNKKFMESGILDEVDKFNSQIKEEKNEIKEENKIKKVIYAKEEDENEIKEDNEEMPEEDENINKINFIAGENQNQYKNEIIIDEGQNNKIKKVIYEKEEDKNKTTKESYTFDEEENKKIKLLGEIDNKFIELKQKFDVIVADKNFVLGEDNYPTVLSYVKQICYLIWKNVNIENGIEEENLELDLFEECSSLEDVLANFANYLLFFVESFSAQQQIEIDKTETPLKSKLEWSSTIYSLCLYKQEKDLLSTDEEIIKSFKDIFVSWQEIIEQN